MEALLSGISDICRRAGDAILTVYEKQDLGVETKDDDSPLTEADLAAHRVIVDGLQGLLPGTPILSEESAVVDYDIRRKWQRYFLVDPLDGTKEFISRNGEFTVNIALVEDGAPILGAVFVPVKDVFYGGYRADDSVAFVERQAVRTPIRTRHLRDRLRAGKALTVVASRRHGSEALEECLRVLQRHFSAIDSRNMGSSLKLCLVAEGEADFYPRLAPTSEWDTAAAHAIVESAGGVVVDTNFVPLRYNTKADILNPFFYVIGDMTFPWESVLEEIDIA